jgi:hypothetical protein
MEKTLGGWETTIVGIKIIRDKYYDARIEGEAKNYENTKQTEKCTRDEEFVGKVEAHTSR